MSSPQMPTFSTTTTTHSPSPSHLQTNNAVHHSLQHTPQSLSLPTIHQSKLKFNIFSHILQQQPRQLHTIERIKPLLLRSEYQLR